MMARLILFNIIRVTIGLTAGVFVVWLVRSSGHGGLSGFIDYAAALFRGYTAILIIVWLALVVFEVVRRWPAYQKKTVRVGSGSPE